MHSDDNETVVRSYVLFGKAIRMDLPLGFA